MKYLKYVLSSLLIVSVLVNCIFMYGYYSEKNIMYKHADEGVAYYLEVFDKYVDLYGSYIRNPERYETEYKNISNLTYDAMNIYLPASSVRNILNKSYNIPAMMSYIINVLNSLNKNSIHENLETLVDINEYLIEINRNMRSSFDGYISNIEKNKNVPNSKDIDLLDENLFTDTKEKLNNIIDDLGKLSL